MFAGLTQQIQQDDTPKYKRKNEGFRKKMRKEYLEARFGVVRQQMMREEHLECVMEVLLKTKENFCKNSFARTMELLQFNQEQSELNQCYSRKRIEQILAEVIVTHGSKLDLWQRCSLVRSLTFLTYYGDSSIESIVGNGQFNDWLRREVDELGIERPEEVEYLNQIIDLLINLSSNQKYGFGLYLAEGDLLRRIAAKLAATTTFISNSDSNYYEFARNARRSMLKTLTNIVVTVGGGNNLSLITKVVGDILNDYQYMHMQPEWFLFLLAFAIQKRGFWLTLLNQTASNTFAYELISIIDHIQARCFAEAFLQNPNDSLSQREGEEFFALLCFLNNLYQAEKNINLYQNIQLTWETLIQNSFNGYMLAVYLENSLLEKNPDHVAEALRMYCNLSESQAVSGKQLVVVRPCDQPLSLLRTLTDEKMMNNQIFGRYALDTLANLLRKDDSFLDSLLELKILDGLLAALDDRNSSRLLCSALGLMRQLVCAEKGKEGRVLKTLENQGILKEAMKLRSHQDRNVFDVLQLMELEFDEVRKSQLQSSQ